MDRHALELKGTVGEDLYVLLSEHALSVASVSRINTLSSPSWNRASFRLELSDGSVCKGRRFESQEAHDRVAYLAQYLPSDARPRVIARRGLAELIEWIEGPILSSIPITGDVLRRAGEVIGAIHEVELPASAPEALRRPGEQWRDSVAAKTDRLCRAGLLSQAEERGALDLAGAHAPASTRVSLVHGDFCPENLVVDAAGILRVIDTDSIAIRTREFDLARIWYRWPMTPEERQAFEDGYGPRDVLASYHAHFLCWAIVVLIGAAEFRLRHQLPDADVPIARLRGILAAE